MFCDTIVIYISRASFLIIFCASIANYFVYFQRIFVMIVSHYKDNTRYIIRQYQEEKRGVSSYSIFLGGQFCQRELLFILIRSQEREGGATDTLPPISYFSVYDTINNLSFLSRVKDGKWGGIVNGSWNGLVAELINHDTDVVMTSLKINSGRETVIDFSVPFLETGITILGKVFLIFKKFFVILHTRSITRDLKVQTLQQQNQSIVALRPLKHS